MSVEITQSLQTFTINSIIEFWLYQIDSHLYIPTADMYTFGWSCKSPGKQVSFFFSSSMGCGNNNRENYVMVWQSTGVRLGVSLTHIKLVWNATHTHSHTQMKIKQQCTNISNSIYRESQVRRGGHTKPLAFSFQSNGVCFGVLICLSRGQRMSLCFLALALLLIPTHLGNSPLFSVFSFLLSFFKPSTSLLLLLLLLSQIPIPPFLPLLSSCPEWSGDMCFPAPAWRERKKSEVRSLPLALPPSLPAEGSRQTGA